MLGLDLSAYSKKGAKLTTRISVNAIAPRQVFEKYVASAEQFAAKMSIRTRYIAAAALVLLILAFWYFVSGTPAPNQHFAAAPVRVATVTRRDMPVVAQA